ncbi:response regulator transcription factor [Variovorax sp. YR750]|uniref:response regulator transcription factor n=1 Tax=Variovorax sp. YR750 TaxID=1884384 RepID=UPI001C433E39|nr:LuxR C-terminal-related transcriptional regulator [Variovorax sp. YR750]
MKHLTSTDLQAWLTAVTDPRATAANLLSWIEGPLRAFFPFRGVVLGHGELVAGQLKITHMLASGLDAEYLQQIATTFELAQRGALQWWLANRQPFLIDPKNPPRYASVFEVTEIEKFGLCNVAGHGVLNVKANAGTYFGFIGVRTPLSEWHLEALRLLTPVLNDLFLANIASREESMGIDGNRSAVIGELTTRERSIVRHLAEGLSNKSIARALGTSEKTVRNQLARIYAHLGVRKRSELIVLLK